MNLNPTVRWLLGAVAAVVGFLAASDPFGLPPWAQGVIATASVLFGALGIVPPQVGGTQQGVVNPSVTEPPAADINERGSVDIITIGAVCGIAAFVLVLVILL